MNQDQIDDFTARLCAIEDLVTYNLARYLEANSDFQSQGIKDSFFSSVPDLGAGIMSVEQLQGIQALILDHRERLVLQASSDEGRDWKRPDKS